MQNLLTIQNLSVDFIGNNGITNALKGISFTVGRGEIVAVVGESGSGKSVTSLSILQLLPPPPLVHISGNILFEDETVESTKEESTNIKIPKSKKESTNTKIPKSKEENSINLLQCSTEQMRHVRGNRIAMIFQEPMTSLNPVKTCGSQVTEAILAHKDISNAEAKQLAIELFQQVKLPMPQTAFNKYPHELSGGQKQRVMIAMAMGCKPGLLICDEPTTALDVTVQKSILQLIKSLQQQNNMGVIFISHDLGVVSEIAHRIVVMYKGNIVEQGNCMDVIQHPQHAYTKALLACRPALHKQGERLPVVSDFLSTKLEVRSTNGASTKLEVQSTDGASTKLEVQSTDRASTKLEVQSTDGASKKLEVRSTDEANTKLEVQSTNGASKKLEVRSTDEANTKLEVQSTDGASTKLEVQSTNGASTKLEVQSTNGASTKLEVQSTNVGSTKLEVQSTRGSTSAEIPKYKEENASIIANANIEISNIKSDNDNKPLLVVDNLSVFYPLHKTFLGRVTEYTKAVNNVSFAVQQGEILGLVGESGCGKTTLGRAVLGLIRPTQGSIVFGGTDISKVSHNSFKGLRKRMQLIFQDPYSSLNPRKTIGEAIAEPLLVHGLFTNPKQRREKVIDLLQKTGLLPEHYNRYPHEFSGGQRQRIVIARALALEPDFIVCDEMVSALDVSVQAQVLNLLNDLKKTFGFTAIFISHDLNVVRYMCDRILVMHRGIIEETGSAGQVYTNPKTAYTKELIGSMPGVINH